MPSSYTLGSHFEKLVRDLVDSGRYASASEVVRDGLRLLEDAEAQRAAKLASLRGDIERGLASGPSAPLDIEAVKGKARTRHQDTAERDA